MFWGGAVEGVIDAAPAEVGQFGDELVDVVAADAEDLEAAMSAAVEGYVCGEGDLVAAGQSAAVVRVQLEADFASAATVPKDGAA